jgi:tetratricopeptide (TPR) repeat protein
MPGVPLDIVASDLLPEIKRWGLNYHEVMAFFMSAAVLKMMEDGSGNVYVHPFELLPDPKTCDHWLEKGRIIAKEGLHSSALKCIEKALSIDSNRADVWVEKGDLIFDFAKALSPTVMFTEKPSVSQTLSRLSGDKERYAEALQCFERAISLDPKCVSALYSKGACLIEIGRPTQDFSKVRQAIECFERVLKIDPSHENAKIALKMCRN